MPGAGRVVYLIFVTANRPAAPTKTHGQGASASLVARAAPRA